MKKLPAALLATTTLLSLQASVVAAETSAGLEEVLVTARKRVESMQEAPLSVSVLSADTLKEAGVSNLADITELVPNLQITRPSRDANVYIRGVGPTRGATDVTELSVGVYIDDVFLLKPKGQLMDLAEVQSVQVLRGPQGTLFGKNTTGGALVVTTLKPAEEFGGYGELTVGNEGRFNVQGSVDVPLSDSLLSKFTVTSVQDDGYDEDPVSGDDLSDEDRLGALAQLRWLASENVTADFSFFYNRIRENNLAQGDCVVTNPNSSIISSGLITPVSGFDLLSDFCERYSDGVASYYQENKADFTLDAYQASANVSWVLNDTMQLKSITAWQYQESPNYTNTNAFSGYPNGQNSLDDGDSTQVSQEFQLTGELFDGSLRYTGGLFYLYDDSDTGLFEEYNGAHGIWGSTGGQVPPGLVAALTNFNVQGQENENNTYAAYTQWSWDATDNLELTAGLRYSYEEREMKTTRTEALPGYEAYADVPGAIIIPGVIALMPDPIFFDLENVALPLPLGETERLDDDESYDNLAPMFSAAYTFSDDLLGDSLDGLMLYASYTEGYKAGGFSDFGFDQLVTFDEEQINSVEAGFKLDAWENRARVNVSVFTMEYDDMQLFVARPDPDPDTISTNQGVTNAGKSTINGAELEVSLLPAEGWLVQFTASFADGEFDEFDDSVVNPETGQVETLDRSDEDLPSLPESSYSLGVQYSWASSMGEWTARADAFYRDDLYWGFDAATWDIPLARENATTDSFTVFNARLSWQFNDSLSVSAWGKNLSDETYYDGGVAEAASLGIAIKSFAPARRYGIDLRYDF